MRDINRIDGITELVNKVWKELPDFRFWQLLLYILETPMEDIPPDPFFWEEDVWKKVLEKALEREVCFKAGGLK